eukprot:3386973-Pyramimonas_sp.AAC.1
MERSFWGTGPSESGAGTRTRVCSRWRRAALHLAWRVPLMNAAYAGRATSPLAAPTQAGQS